MIEGEIFVHTTGLKHPIGASFSQTTYSVSIYSCSPPIHSGSSFNLPHFGVSQFEVVL